MDDLFAYLQGSPFLNTIFLVIGLLLKVVYDWFYKFRKGTQEISSDERRNLREDIVYLRSDVLNLRKEVTELRDILKETEEEYSKRLIEKEFEYKKLLNKYFSISVRLNALIGLIQTRGSAESSKLVEGFLQAYRGEYEETEGVMDDVRTSDT